MTERLWDAISRNNLKEVHQILYSGGIDLNKPYENSSGRKITYLLEACIHSSSVIVCALVKAGANVNACELLQYGQQTIQVTPAVVRSDRPIRFSRHSLRPIVPQPSNVIYHYNSYKATALILAVIQRKVNMVKKLLHRCGADVNATNDEGLAPLHFIAKLSDGPLEKYQQPFQQSVARGAEEQLAGLLFAAGATLDLADKMGRTSLHFAVMVKDAAIVQLLLQHRASADILDSKGMNPLHIATTARDVSMTQVLLQHSANVNIPNSEGLTPLHIVVKANDVAMAQLLLQHHARVDIPDRKGITPLHTSAKSLGYEMCKILLQNTGADSSTVVNLAANDGTTPVCVLIQTMVRQNVDSDETVKLFIDKAADLTGQQQGMTLLHLAAERGFIKTVKLLVESGADIHAETPNTGLSPLDMAEHGNKQDVVDYLTKRLEQDASEREAKKRETPSVEQMEGEEESQESDTSVEEILGEGAVGESEEVLVVKEEGDQKEE